MNGRFKANLLANNSRLGKSLLIVGLFIVVLVLELSTPSDYVFGYLYTGPILLANSWLKDKATLQATCVAMFLTMLNVWVPGGEVIVASIVANRAIAVMALMVTGLLSQRLRRTQQAIAQTQAKLEAQEQLVKLREDFASTLTHDLKTPLLGAIETLKAFQKEKFGIVSSQQQKVLATMIHSHDSSLQFVETLLDVYRNDTEGLKLHLEPVDLTVLAEDVATTLMEVAATRRVNLCFRYGESDFRSSLWVKGDAWQLQRVLTNLLINAINHSRRGDRVEVILESQASYQVVKILDTGAGIPPEQFPHLFERFYQGHSDRQAKGSGLGLYLSRQIIEAHNGIIWAENRSDSKDVFATKSGAIFGFKLSVYPYQPS
ncbi:periplasmic sensor signal transduction histidine kinase [Tolypothrix sp. NIES-4075]|uniref:sensor histidine kinase n=1 Tax=Tolypothrix sp. NIES-4075 TaxID=2005459 RepID=UPI000B7596B8|nr:HAMP domain-containing sensor histidine kinase [Tolypothrix sp. NIES-4075]GAX44119.1 periplasmic sensor signal transduction histidine kinase [Tolypothrix sp. NIES-4075]